MSETEVSRPASLKLPKAKLNMYNTILFHGTNCTFEAFRFLKEKFEKKKIYDSLRSD